MTCLVIALHKPYELPNDPLYVPLFVGAKGKPSPMDGMRRDDEGDEISSKNPYYSELTALYWAWKNLDAEAIGLVHYRRYFRGRRRVRTLGQMPRLQRVLTGAEAEELMKGCDIVVPKARHYYIESLYTHYAHTLDGRHLDLAREIVQRMHPEYMDALERVYARTYGSMFNMCIMRREYLDAYCSWLFPILSELEARLSPDVEQMSGFAARLYGRVSEILWNVWLEYVRREDATLRIRELPVINLESEHWMKKGTAFLKAKFFGKKYEKSF